MSKTNRTNYRREEREQKGTRRNERPATSRNSRAERHITVRSVRRDPPDLRKLSRAVIQLAMAEIEADEAAQAAKTAEPTPDATVTDEQEATHDD